MGVDTEYVITRQVPVQRRRRGRLGRQLHAVRAQRCARRLRERACALLPVPPRHNWLSLSNGYTVIRSARISLIFVYGFRTIKFFIMISNLLQMVSRIKPVTRRVPGLPIRDNARGCNNRAQMCAQLSAIDVTANTVFERLYLVLEMRKIAY